MVDHRFPLNLPKCMVGVQIWQGKIIVCVSNRLFLNHIYSNQCYFFSYHRYQNIAMKTLVSIFTKGIVSTLFPRAGASSILRLHLGGHRSQWDDDWGPTMTKRSFSISSCCRKSRFYIPLQAALLHFMVG